MPPKIPEKELLNDIRRVGSIVSGDLTQSKYIKHGEYSHRVMYNRFGSWQKARSMAGLEGPEQYTWTPIEELLECIRELAEEINRVPSQKDMNERGRYSEEVYYRRFGSWTESVRRAGFEPRERGAPTGKENPSWDGGYDPYYGPNWYEQRRKARKRDGYECVACGVTDAKHKERYGWELEVHHIIAAGWFGDDYESMNDLSNLITLCRPHHLKYERLPAKECDKLKS